MLRVGYEPSVRKGEVISCVRPRGHCDLQFDNFYWKDNEPLIRYICNIHSVFKYCGFTVYFMQLSASILYRVKWLDEW
jgi:hypothetical protein